MAEPVASVDSRIWWQNSVVIVRPRTFDGNFRWTRQLTVRILKNTEFGSSVEN